MNDYMYSISSHNAVLSHHGIKGQKWGVRRWQTSDGSLTSEGKKRYNSGNFVQNRRAGSIRKLDKQLNRLDNKLSKKKTKYRNALQKENSARVKYEKLNSKQNNIDKKLNRAQNGVGAKLIGQDKYKVNKLQKQSDKNSSKLRIAEGKYNKAQAYAQKRGLATVKISDLMNRKQIKLDTKSVNFISKYGQYEYNKL